MSGSYKQQDFRLWHFHGGIQLEEHKEMSLHSPIAEATIPEKLIIPAQQHIGEATEVIVNTGDHVYKGQPLTKLTDYVSAPVHASTSGEVIAIGDEHIPHPSGLKGLCITIRPDGEDKWLPELPVALNDYQSIPAPQLRERIRWAGIVGLGGATFPTSVKLNPGPDKPIETLIVNAAECEPYITCDDALIQAEAEKIIEGVEITLHILSARHCLIGIEDNKPKAIEQLREIASQNADNRIQVIAIPTLYPSGGEKQLIKILTNQEVPSNGLPADIGIVCHNVGTLKAISDAVLRGIPLIDRVVTVTGPGILNPQNMYALNGTSMSALIEQAGGYTDKADHLIMGGPMMGIALHNDQLPVTKGTNCLLLTDQNMTPDNDQARSCIRCGQCADACPASLLPQQLYWHAHSKDFDKVQDYHLFDCIECGCCAYVCPSHIPLVQYYRFAKTEIWAREEEKRKSDIARRRHEFRDQRMARIEAEKQERLRKKKEALEKKNKSDVDPKKAAIAAAMQRAAEKKQRLKESGQTPANTDNLTEAQQQQVDKADQRRSESP